MNIRDNVEKLIKSEISAYQVAKDTGLAQKTLYRIFTGETALENVAFGKMEILAKYYEKERAKNERK